MSGVSESQYLVTCRICGDKIDPESPGTVRAPNPHTFRMAWMCLWCAEDALDEIEKQPAKNQIEGYKNRLEEYDMRFG